MFSVVSVSDCTRLIALCSQLVNLYHTEGVSEFTRILASKHQGDAKAANELLPLVYQELRKFDYQRGIVPRMRMESRLQPARCSPLQGLEGLRDQARNASDH